MVKSLNFCTDQIVDYLDLNLVTFENINVGDAVAVNKQNIYFE